MKSKLFFLSLSTAFAICANANAAISIGASSWEDSNKINSVSYFDEDTGENVELDLSTFLKNAKFNPFSEDGQRLKGFDIKSYGDEVGRVDITLNGFTISMDLETFRDFPVSFDDITPEDYEGVIAEAYIALSKFGLLNVSEDEIYNFLDESGVSDILDYSNCEKEDYECFAHEKLSGTTLDEYLGKTPDNGGSDSGSSSGTISGSGSSTAGTTTMPTGHRTFYAPAEAAADVHEGKDNTVIISF